MKNLKKISAVLVAVNMFASALPSVFASDILKISGPIFKDSGEQTISAPQPGFVKTQIEAENQTDAEKSACVVVSATDNSTGDIKAINSDSKTIASKAKETLEAGITFESGQTYNYYVWDSILNHTPLVNTPPTNVKIDKDSVQAKTNSIDVSFDPSDDDKGVKNYIFRIDGKEVAKSTEPSYSIVGLDRNQSYKCEIVACDDEGLESKIPAVIEAKTTTMQECILAVNDNKYFNFHENHDGDWMDSFTSLDTIEGRDCYENTKTTKVCFFYFPVSPAYISQDVRNVAIEIMFYDDTDKQGSGDLSIQYNAADDSHGKSMTINSKTNTKTWKTIHAQLDDAKFINPEDLTYSAFRISAPSGTRIYKVSLCPGDDYSPDVPNVKFCDGLTETYDMNFYPQDAVSNYSMSYQTKAGVPCLVSPNGKPFEFDIKDDLALKTGGYIEATYYDDGTDTLVLNYNNPEGLKKEVAFTNSGEFKTVQFPLDAATFSNSISGSGGRKFDFTLSTKNGSVLALSSVKYVPGDSDYVIKPKTESVFEVNADGLTASGDLSLERWSPLIWPNPSDYNYRGILFSSEDGSSKNAAFARKGDIDGKAFVYNVPALNYASNDWHYWRNSFFFDIPDTFLSGSNHGKVELEVEYYVPSGSGKLTLFVRSNNGTTTEDSQSAWKYQNSVSTGGWKTMKYEIPSNVEFTNGWHSYDLNSDCNLKLMPEGCIVYIHKVTVRKVED